MSENGLEHVQIILAAIPAFSLSKVQKDRESGKGDSVIRQAGKKKKNEKKNEKKF